MASIQPTAISRSSPQAEPNNFWENSKKVLLLAGASATLYFLFRFFTRQDLPTPQPRSLVGLFPQMSKNATQDIRFTPTAGIFKINKDLLLSQAEQTLPRDLRNSIEQVFIECTYRNQIFHTQLLSIEPSVEVYIPEIPSKGEITARVINRDYNLVQIDLQTHHSMSTYEIFSNNLNLKVRSAPYTMPKLVGELYDRKKQALQTPFQITLGQDRPVRFTNLNPDDLKNHCIIKNQSNEIHILFFQILGTHPNLSPDEAYVLPVTLSALTTKELPHGFFKKNWELAYFSVHGNKPPEDTALQLLYIRDSISTPER